MFSIMQKRQISDAVQKILKDTNHPELPDDEIQFHLHVDGAECWSWADIRNNGSIDTPSVNPHNERKDVDLPKYISISSYDFDELKTLYADALNNCDTQFNFKGELVLVDYAKYMIEYLKPRFEGM